LAEGEEGEGEGSNYHEGGRKNAIRKEGKEELE